MIITLKDGSKKEYSEAKSVIDVAFDISEGLARGIDFSQPLYQGERLLDVGIQLEKHGSPLSLFHVPGRRVFKQ